MKRKSGRRDVKNRRSLPAGSYTRLGDRARRFISCRFAIFRFLQSRFHRYSPDHWYFPKDRPQALYHNHTHIYRFAGKTLRGVISVLQCNINGAVKKVEQKKKPYIITPSKIAICHDFAGKIFEKRRLFLQPLMPPEKGGAYGYNLRGWSHITYWIRFENETMTNSPPLPLLHSLFLQSDAPPYNQLLFVFPRSNPTPLPPALHLHFTKRQNPTPDFACCVMSADRMFPALS